MQQTALRNIAIIAHVDHGKTTLVDRLLQATGVFRENQQLTERILDSNEQERERGITILAKNFAIRYQGIKINVIDTPGHADFGGEVERVLNMADGALLLVDAFEGPMPQTRFVLRHALQLGLKPIVVINKVDRRGGQPLVVLDAVFELMLQLDANDQQLDFPVVYTSATEGYARYEPDDDNNDMIPLLDTIISQVPGPTVDLEAPLAMQICTVDHSDYVGRIGIGRIFSGTLHQAENVLVVKNDGSSYQTTIKQLFTFEALGRVECDEALAGDIVAVVGVDDADVGDLITSRLSPQSLDPIEVEQPTMAVVFAASTSPLVGREGSIVGARQINERLQREAQSNISMRITLLPDGAGVEVAGRGILHLSVLMETMRREGYEFQVGRPQVLYQRDASGRQLEPIEEATVDVPSEYVGKVIEVFGSAGGELVSMTQHTDRGFLVFRIPSRSTLGLRTRILNATRGEAVLFHHFLEYGVFNGEAPKRKFGVMIAKTNEKSVAYALDTLQARGTLFVGPGEDCYEGMLVGESTRVGDMVVNVARTKHLTNMRSSTADKAIQLTPPVTFSLEEALEYIEDDELIEVTPQSIRLRKRILSTIDRRKANKSD
ncbi:MAG: translational GTPase TypA [Coriobacteriales bacterium]|jgi:GTP-binding protein|nr:translational GTPase TypA [Coriobacteriales bacterium]